jgi:hypothetical protein
VANAFHGLSIGRVKPDGLILAKTSSAVTERAQGRAVNATLGGAASRMKQMTDLSKTLGAVILCCGFAGSAVAATDTTPTGSTNSQTVAPNTQPPARISQRLRDDLTKAGFKDITIMPSSFMVRAKDSQGNPMMMVINPDSVTEVTEQTAPAVSGAMKGNVTGSASNATAKPTTPPAKP